jgi:hypothetical protein
MPQGLTAIFRPAPVEKTNPIKPNSSRRSPERSRTSRGEAPSEAGTNPICHGQASCEAGFIAAQPQAKPDLSRRSSQRSRNKPNLSRRSPERSRIPPRQRNTTYEIRHPTYDIRHTPAPRGTSDIQTSKDPPISHLQSGPESIILLQPDPGNVYETRTTDNQLQAVRRGQR